MHTMRVMGWRLLAAVAACSALGLLPGCELLVDFDRTKIPAPDSGVADATVDQVDASSPDVADETNPDAEADATAPNGDDSGDLGEATTDLGDAADETTGSDASVASGEAAAPDSSPEASSVPVADAALDGPDGVAAEASVGANVDAASVDAADTGAADANTEASVTSGDGG